MTIIADVLQVSTPVGIILFGMWFLVAKLWPLFETEREFSRQHKARRTDNEHKADLAISAAIEHLAVSVQTCPLKPE